MWSRTRWIKFHDGNFYRAGLHHETMAVVIETRFRRPEMAWWPRLESQITLCDRFFGRRQVLVTGTAQFQARPIRIELALEKPILKGVKRAMEKLLRERVDTRVYGGYIERQRNRHEYFFGFGYFDGWDKLEYWVSRRRNHRFSMVSDRYTSSTGGFEELRNTTLPRYVQEDENVIRFMLGLSTTLAWRQARVEDWLQCYKPFTSGVETREQALDQIPMLLSAMVGMWGEVGQVELKDGWYEVSVVR